MEENSRLPQTWNPFETGHNTVGFEFQSLKIQKTFEIQIFNIQN